ncbi:MAG: DUF134 domain-containing protein [Candidatus Celaenobacter antarcticus]|nr:DUF134 domain-containing protein [Candidatus Celaenobacter antarcticus]
MSRPRKIRRVSKPPICSRFKPVGIPARLLDVVDLSVDEYEALRLADYEGLEHKEAAEKMGISRPTFTRLIDQARKKFASGIIEGKEISIEGGNFQFLQHVARCRNCGSTYNYTQHAPDKCPECNEEDLENLNLYYQRGRGRGRGKWGQGK